jgi:hypothetical protein
MLNIEITEIGDDSSNLIKVINTLFDNYNTSFANIKKELLNTTIIPANLLDSLESISKFKKDFDTYIIPNAIKNSNIDNPVNRDSSSKAVRGLPMAEDDYDRIHKLINKYKEIYNKIQDIQFIFTLIYLQIDNNRIINFINNPKNIIAYAKILYEILENILKFIIPILKNIHIFNRESKRYLHQVCRLRLYTGIFTNKNATDLSTLNYYRITSDKIDSIDKLDSTIQDEIDKIIPKSHKFDYSYLINNTMRHLSNIDDINYKKQIEAIQSNIKKLEDFDDLKKITKEKIDSAGFEYNPEHSIDYYKEYKEYDDYIKLLNGYDEELEADINLDRDVFNKMLRYELRTKPTKEQMKLYDLIWGECE